MKEKRFSGTLLVSFADGRRKAKWDQCLAVRYFEFSELVPGHFEWLEGQKSLQKQQCLSTGRARPTVIAEHCKCFGRRSRPAGSNARSFEPSEDCAIQSPT
jgi:hypothetical protein